MIKQITIENFFSFSDSQTIPLNSEINILIGINGSGKSNFIKAIELLYESIVGDGMEKILSGKWSGLASISNYSKNEISEICISYEFDRDVLKAILNGHGHYFQRNPVYQIRIKPNGNLGRYSLQEWVYHEATGNNVNPFTFLKVENERGIVSEKGEKETKIKRLEAFLPSELVLRQINDPDRYFPLYTLKAAIEQMAIYSHFDTTTNSMIRQLSSFYTETKLRSDGHNLTSLLNYLNGEFGTTYDKIIEKIRQINPYFRDLVFRNPVAGKTLLSLKEHQLEKAILIDGISDGTLRFLLLLAILYNPSRGHFICIDEPEIGLHPDMINAIAEGISFASQNGTQVLVATHSPLLLNAFELDDLKIFEKGKDNQTVVTTKSEDDFEGWTEEFLVGQMWLRGQLGGVRW